jgi:hypothetical protein
MGQDYIPVIGTIVARPSDCRIETRLDAWRSGVIESPGKSVETSLDAADTSVRATAHLEMTTHG